MSAQSQDGGIDPDGIEDQVSESLLERLKDQEPSDERKAELRAAHRHHLVRATTSQLALDHDIGLDGVEVDATAEIPDTYCFTCGEWVGLSGIDLSGTPRSRRDAYWLHGPPEEIVRARDAVDDGLVRLANRVMADAPMLDTPADAIEFIEGRLEKLADSQEEP